MIFSNDEKGSSVLLQALGFTSIYIGSENAWLHVGLDKLMLGKGQCSFSLSTPQNVACRKIA
jgi:hypothetical protein